MKVLKTFHDRVTRFVEEIQSSIMFLFEEQKKSIFLNSFEFISEVVDKFNQSINIDITEMEKHMQVLKNTVHLKEDDY